MPPVVPNAKVTLKALVKGRAPVELRVTDDDLGVVCEAYQGPIFGPRPRRPAGWTLVWLRGEVGWVRNGDVK